MCREFVVCQDVMRLMCGQNRLNAALFDATKFEGFLKEPTAHSIKGLSQVQRELSSACYGGALASLSARPNCGDHASERRAHRSAARSDPGNGIQGGTAWDARVLCGREEGGGLRENVLFN